MELALEKITVKAEIQIDIDDKEFDLLDHYLKRIDDDIYETAEAMGLVGGKVALLQDQIQAVGTELTELANQLYDKEGNPMDASLSNILMKYLNGDTLTADEVEAFNQIKDINNSVGKTMEDLADQYLKLIETLEELKTKGIDKVEKAFDELSDKTEKQINIFDHYESVLQSVQNITDLLGLTLDEQTFELLNNLGETSVKNSQARLEALNIEMNRIVESLGQAQAQLDRAIADQDQQQIDAWQKVVDNIQDRMNETQEAILSTLQDTLDKAQNILTSSINRATRQYESMISGVYGDLSWLQTMYDYNKNVRDLNVQNFEKYYRLNKLERDINKANNDLAQAGIRNNQRLNALLKDVNNSQRDGKAMSDAELTILEKRVEYEKALAELENARNAKSEVRLQRDASGNWGYIYTASESDVNDLEDRAAQAQYDLQKTIYDFQEERAEAILSLYKELGDLSNQIIQDVMSDTSIAQADKAIEIQKRFTEASAQILTTLNYNMLEYQELLNAMGKTLSDFSKDVGNETDKNLPDTFGETILGQMLGGDLNDLSNLTDQAFRQLDEKIKEALAIYNKDTANTLDLVETFSSPEMIGGLIDNIDKGIDDSTAKVVSLDEAFGETFTNAIEAAEQFRDIYMQGINDTIDDTEAKLNRVVELIAKLNGSLDASVWFSNGYSTSTDYRHDAGVSHAPTNNGYVSSISNNSYDPAALNNTQIAAIARVIDLNANLMGTIGQANQPPTISDDGMMVVGQEIHIDANFPSVTNWVEIEQAFDNLSNKASQYANKKNMQSITFSPTYNNV